MWGRGFEHDPSRTAYSQTLSNRTRRKCSACAPLKATYGNLRGSGLVMNMADSLIPGPGDMGPPGPRAAARVRSRGPAEEPQAVADKSRPGRHGGRGSSRTTLV